VYVSGNLLVHYEPGNKRRHVSPDVFVTLGLEPGLRLNYILWQESRHPNMVIELTSKTTRKEDQTKKFDIYQNIIKVPEYFLFDPTKSYLKPQLQGYRLAEGKYVPIEPTNGRFVCEQLGLELAAEDDFLRFFEQASGRKLLTTDEEIEQRDAQIEQRDAQIEQRDAEIERLKAELERHRKS